MISGGFVDPNVLRSPETVKTILATRKGLGPSWAAEDGFSGWTTETGLLFSFQDSQQAHSREVR